MPYQTDPPKKENIYRKARGLWSGGKVDQRIPIGPIEFSSKKNLFDSGISSTHFHKFYPSGVPLGTSHATSFVTDGGWQRMGGLEPLGRLSTYITLVGLFMLRC